MNNVFDVVKTAANIAVQRGSDRRLRNLLQLQSVEKARKGRVVGCQDRQHQ